MPCHPELYLLYLALLKLLPCPRLFKALSLLEIQLCFHCTRAGSPVGARNQTQSWASGHLRDYGKVTPTSLPSQHRVPTLLFCLSFLPLGVSLLLLSGRQFCSFWELLGVHGSEGSCQPQSFKPLAPQLLAAPLDTLSLPPYAVVPVIDQGPGVRGL